MARMMTQMAAIQATAMNNPPPATQIISQPVAMTEGIIHSSPIDVKFDGTNYSFWSQAMAMYVRGRERMKHLTGEPAPPSKTKPLYQKWATDDVVVKGWIINSLEPRLRGSYIRYPTARDVWKAMATTYYDKSDEAQVYALNRQVMRVKQEGRAIEVYFDELQGLWQEINFRCPNPMEYAVDIDKFNTSIQKTRVYTFLDGLDDTLDGVIAQVVMLSPFPSIEQAYGYVRREATRQGIMIKGGVDSNSLAMISKGYKSGKGYDFQNKNYSQSSYNDKAKMRCMNYGKNQHTKEQFFEVVGYPEWWKGDKKKKYEERGKGVAATAAAVVSREASKQQIDPNQHGQRQPAAASRTGQQPTTASNSQSRAIMVSRQQPKPRERTITVKVKIAVLKSAWVSVISQM